MILVDSSFLIAFFNKKDSQHEKAIEAMKQYDQNREEFLITEQILGETATVLLYYHSLEAAKQFIEFSKQKCTIQNWDDTDFIASLGIFEKQQWQLSYIDSTIVYLAKKLRVSVACYDGNILKTIEK